LDGVVVVYAVTVEVEGERVSSDQLDYLTLQSNLVENSYREVKERNYITEAQHKDNIISDTTLVLDPDSLQLYTGKTYNILNTLSVHYHTMPNHETQHSGTVAQGHL
jgi:hypothetical protein